MIKNGSKSVVADIAWSWNCHHLLFAAGESIIAVEFEATELEGTPLTQEQMKDIVFKTNQSQQKKRLTMLTNELPSQPTIPTIPTKPTIPTIPSQHTIPTIPTQPTIPTIPTQPTQPTIPTTPSVTLSQTSSINSPPTTIPITPTIESKKRELDEVTHETNTTSRKRKKTQVTQTQVSLPQAEPISSLPQACYTLPYTTQITAGVSKYSLSLQCMSLTNHAYSELLPDESVLSTIQIIDNTTPITSFICQGRIALLDTTLTSIATVTKSGWLQLFSSTGVSLTMPIYCMGLPAGLAIINNESVERIAVVTTNGMLRLFEYERKELKLVWECSLNSLISPEVQEIHFQFTCFDILYISMVGKEKTSSVKIDVLRKCIYPCSQAIASYSLYSIHSNNSSLASSITTNPVLIVYITRSE